MTTTLSPELLQNLNEQANPPRFTSENHRRQVIESEARFYANKLSDGPNRILPRTWGFEIETPEADRIYRQLTREDHELLQFSQDASVQDESQDCNCECSSCTYHECNCDNCEDYNDDPDHDCGNSDCHSGCGEYQEIKTPDGGVKSTRPEALELLDRLGLGNLRITDECGVHIHVSSGDLDKLQVAKVITSYRLAQPLLAIVFGEHRIGSRFAEDNYPEQETATRLWGEATAKMHAVNTAHHFGNLHNLGTSYRQPTIEFRHHEGTNETARVRLWAWLMVGLVEFAKSDRPVYWLGKCQTLEDLIRELRLETA